MLCVITANVPALKDTLIIGDNFLYENFRTLQAINTHARQNHCIQPHLYCYYNVEARFSAPMSLNWSFLSHITNCFIAALNEKHHLPRYVLIVIDKDWLSSSKILEYGMSRAIKVAIQWILCQFQRNLDTRKENLYVTKPGALATGSEPQLIWVTMVR